MADGRDDDRDRQLDIMERLMVAMEGINHMGERLAQPAPFKPPRYDGSGDVELYIERFTEITDANGWPGVTATIHLRESLQGVAAECGRPETMQEIFNNLRSRFGISPREARAKVATLRKASKVSMQQHADEVSRLIRRGYEDTPDIQRGQLVLETFINTLGNPYLQRHLMGMQLLTVDAAVVAANDYLSVKVHPVGGVRQVEEGETEGVQQLTTQGTDTLLQLTKTVAELSKQVESLKRSETGPSVANRGPTGTTTSGNPPRRNNRLVCWGCQQPGHRRQECPINPWEQVKQTKADQGNEGPLQQ